MIRQQIFTEKNMKTVYENMCSIRRCVGLLPPDNNFDSGSDFSYEWLEDHGYKIEPTFITQGWEPGPFGTKKCVPTSIWVVLDKEKADNLSEFKSYYRQKGPYDKKGLTTLLTYQLDRKKPKNARENQYFQQLVFSNCIEKTIIRTAEKNNKTITKKFMIQEFKKMPEALNFLASVVRQQKIFTPEVKKQIIQEAKKSNIQYCEELAQMFLGDPASTDSFITAILGVSKSNRIFNSTYDEKTDTYKIEFLTLENNETERATVTKR